MTRYRMKLWASLHTKRGEPIDALRRAATAAFAVAPDQVHGFWYPKHGIDFGLVPVSVEVMPSDEHSLNPGAAFPHYIQLYLDAGLSPVAESVAEAIARSLDSEIVLHAFAGGDKYWYARAGGPAIRVELDEDAAWEDLVELSQASLQRISSIAAA